MAGSSSSLVSPETYIAGVVAMFALFVGTTFVRTPVTLKSLSTVTTLQGIKSWSSFLIPTSPQKRLIHSEAREVLTPAGTPMPKVVHRVVPPQEVKERVLVIGDIHGCYDELTDLLDACKYKPERDSVVLVGDLVNKGPKSAEVVRFARENKFLVVRGNHDDSALEAYFRVGRYQKSRPPAYDYVSSFSKEDVDWLSQLPYTISLPHLNTLVVHAGIIPEVPLAKQKAVDMSRMRNVVLKGNGIYEGRDKTKEGDGWVNHWKGPQHIFFGHDAKRGLQLAEFATGLDTGCCYGRYLTAVILPSRERVQVPARTTHVNVEDKD